jgi:hypothetical protein
LQVPFINVCVLGWSCFLALKANEESVPEQKSTVKIEDISDDEKQEQQQQPQQQLIVKQKA